MKIPRGLAGLLGIALLLAACAATSSPPAPSSLPGGRGFGPPVWNPAVGAFIDPFSGNAVRGGGR